MGFDKMKFEKIINNNEVQHLINGKYVTKETYDSLMADESLYQLPPLPKMNGSPKNSCDIDNTDEEENCQCEECQVLLQIIQDIKVMDDYEALDGLREYIETIKIKTHYETASQIYNEIGNNMVKVSGKLEGQLELYLSQFEVE